MWIKTTLVAAFLLALLPSSALAAGPGDQVPDGKYYIQSAREFGRTTQGFWDLPGTNPNITAGQQISVWTLSDRGGDRQYSFRRGSHPNGQAYVEILVSNVGDARVTVAKGQKKNILKGKKKIPAGALMIERAANADSQLFTLRHVGGGQFVIATFDGRLLDVSDSGKNGADIIASNKVTDIDASARWMLIDVATNKPFVPTVAAAPAPRARPRRR